MNQMLESVRNDHPIPYSILAFWKFNLCTETRSGHGLSGNRIGFAKLNGCFDHIYSLIWEDHVTNENIRPKIEWH